MRSFAFRAGLMISVLALSLLPACVRSMSPEELKAAVEVLDVQTKWVSKAYQPWPPKLVLVPVISFRIKNHSSKPLNYVNFNALFKFRDDQENLGDNFMAAIRKTPVNPGETSPEITLKSNFGVEGKSLASFKDNPQWRPVRLQALHPVQRLSPRSPRPVRHLPDDRFPGACAVGQEKREEKK